MSNIFTANFFQDNRTRFRKSIKENIPIVVAANGILQRNSDIAYPFRQDSNFWYLTGIDEPDVLLIIDKDIEYLIVDERDERRAAFDGAVDIQKMQNLSGIRNIFGRSEGWNKLSERLSKATQVATLAANRSYDESHGMYANPARARLRSMLEIHNPDIKLIDARLHLAKMRMIKRPQELKAIQKAIDISIEAFEDIARNLKNYAYEHEIELDITKKFLDNRSVHAYQPIVAAGANACTLHYVQNDSPLNKNELLLIDAGAEFMNYAADITRTMPLGKPNARQKEVIDAVSEVQEYAFSLLKPGVVMRDYEKQVESFMGEVLKRLGVLENPTTESIRKYYPHATSHFLGLDTHDVADYTLPLAEGMVLTVEPGIYIPEESIGVRIEDNVVITKNGNKNLTKSLPK